MRKEISDLVAAVAALKSASAAEIANSAALKAKLDAAIAGQLSAVDIAALAQVTSDVQGVTQAQADSAAVNSPSN